ncbi:hypothetical protein SRB17_71610 [Streptomyces sp. RB17]|nr:hypothetical protein [Streptomyces sp. RB17]
MDAQEVMLDELAQGLRPLPEGIAWFEGLNTEEQSAVRRDLYHFCVQARVGPRLARPDRHPAGQGGRADAGP